MKKYIQTSLEIHLFFGRIDPFDAQKFCGRCFSGENAGTVKADPVVSRMYAFARSHKGAFTLRPGQNAVLDHLGQCGADGDAADSELFHEFCFRGKFVTGF